MTKKEFINALVEENNILKEDATKIARVVFGEVRRQLLKGREVRIDGVGSFSFKYKEPKLANNNLHGEHRPVGPRMRLKFTIFPSMQRALNEELAEEIARERNDV